MKLLQIDTAANHCAACVFDGETDTVVHAVTRDIGTGHAEQLLDVIGEALEGAGLDMQAIGRIGVVVGPGSFTGVRVGVATARGLALALGVHAVGVSTLQALAAEAHLTVPLDRIAAVVDARRDQFYSAVYDREGVEIEPPAIGSREQTLARIGSARAFIGSGARALAIDLPLLGEGATAGIETYARLASGKPAVGRPTPLYLRDADAKTQAGFILPGRD